MDIVITENWTTIQEPVMIVLEYRTPHTDLLHREVMIHFRVDTVALLEWTWLPLLPFALFNLALLRVLPILGQARLDLWENSGDLLLKQVDTHVRILNTLTEEIATTEYHTLLHAWEVFVAHIHDQVLHHHSEAQQRTEWRWLTESLSPTQMHIVSADHWFQGYEEVFYPNRDRVLMP